MNPQTTPCISICVLTYNREQELLELLYSMERLHNYKELVVEVILWNNNSSDNYDKAKQYIQAHPELKINYIESDVNYGVAVGRNKIMSMAKGPYLLLIDDDIEFDRADDLIKLANLYTQERYIKNKTAIINVDVYYHSTRERQVNAFPHKKYKKYLGREWFLTGHFAAGAAIYRKDVMEEMNYFPSDILYGMEEYDLSYRLIQAGYTIAYDNCVLLWHKEIPKGRMTSKEKDATLWHNKAMVFWTYMPILYFITLNIMWGSRYLIRTKDIAGFFRTCAKIKKTIKSRRRSPLSPQALSYLKSVEARMWY
jgi:GT2 family glycosyltransferase